jgi:hypothetical protein
MEIKCTGKLCFAKNGIGHSKECEAEHAELIDSGVYDTPGNRNPYHRYLGYKDKSLPKNSNEDQKRAWREGIKARQVTGR